MSRRFNFIERMTGTPTGNRTLDAGRKDTRQDTYIHTCITTGGSSQLSTLHSANKFGLAKGVGSAGGWCYERGIYGVLPIGQSQTVLKMAKGLDQRFSHAPTERISQAAAL